ncbi:c-type cytochrome [Aromatoleum petrolei]|uniref:Cytochrome C class I n=1 Tax=Aromatoleum petrolei TaxID=76116 RepID=A0ABX1MXL5_9RHOO|nr:cytochrome C class I [Aromatoleum petrolei]NMF90839.1 cytochrome C class I [Aromatoleum petrolei]QTQ34578.1 putative cytochrome c [Aromatoleum petrolei]
MKLVIALGAGLALSAAAALSASAAQTASGPLAQCVACHPIEKGAPHTVGPNLNGVFGQAVAHAPGFVFSKSLRARGGNWTEEELHRWLEAPQTYAPGTKMAFSGLKDAVARQEVIDALKGLR